MSAMVVLAERVALNSLCREAVRNVLGARIGLRLELRPATSFYDDLQCDSIDMVSITMALEEAIGVEVPDDVAAQIETFGDMIAAAHTLLQSKG